MTHLRQMDLGGCSKGHLSHPLPERAGDALGPYSSDFRAGTFSAVVLPPPSLSECSPGGLKAGVPPSGFQPSLDEPLLSPENWARQPMWE